MHYLLLLIFLVPSTSYSQAINNDSLLEYCTDNYRLALVGAQVAQEHVRDKKENEQTRRIVDVAFNRALASISCSHMEEFQSHQESLNKIFDALHQLSNHLYCLEWFNEGKEKLKTSLSLAETIDDISDLTSSFGTSRDDINRRSVELLGESLYAFKSAKKFCDVKTNTVIDQGIPYYQKIYDALMDK